MISQVIPECLCSGSGIDELAERGASVPTDWISLLLGGVPKK